MHDGRITTTYLIIKVVIKLTRSEEVLSCRAKVILLHGILTTPIIEESNAFPFDIIHLEEYIGTQQLRQCKRRMQL